jgi:hypothetical protein
MPFAASSKKKWFVCFVAELLAFLLVLQKQVEKKKVTQKSINLSITIRSSFFFIVQ